MHKFEPTRPGARCLVSASRPSQLRLPPLASPHHQGAPMSAYRRWCLATDGARTSAHFAPSPSLPLISALPYRSLSLGART